MKIKLMLLVIVVTISNVSYGQFTFGVSPGFKINSAYFGYSFNKKLVPYLGFQYLKGSYNLEEKGEKYDYDLAKVISYTNTTEISANVYIPNLGLKYFFHQKNKIKAYLSLSAYKAFIDAKVESSDTDDEINANLDELKLWGAEFGFGIEYFFDDNFSLGGEFGLRYINFKSHNTLDYEFYNPDNDDFQSTTITTDMNLNMSPSFSKITLNFYF